MTRRRVRALQKRKAKQRQRRHDQSQLRVKIEHIIKAMGLRDLVKITRLGDECLHLMIGPRPRVIPDPEQVHDTKLIRMALDLKKELDRVRLNIYI